MYPPELVQPMKEDLTRAGFKELLNAGEVDETINNAKGTLLVVVNSVCGCAAGNMRPGVKLSLEGDAKPNSLTTVFAGVDKEATDQALDITPKDKVIAVLPFFHVFGLSNVLHLALVHGASVVLVPQYSPGNLLKTIMKTHPSLIIPYFRP